jgi:L-rhamnose isomerase / sugar isomerase
MIQTVMTAQDLWLKAALVDRSALKRHQLSGAIVDAENVLKTAFNTNVDNLLARWRASKGVEANPLDAYRASGYGDAIAKERVARRKELGIQAGAAYA